MAPAALLPRALVLLNPLAGGGRAGQRFGVIRPALEESFAVEVVVLDPAGRWRGRLAAAVRSGVRAAIAAGGDGTVGSLADALVSCPESGGTTVALGGVGLGSSNDFHKPVTSRIAGVPVRIDLDRAAPRDLGRATYWNDDGVERQKVFAVSASCGATARANARFNHGGALFALVKRRRPEAAILWAALATIARHSDLEAAIDVGQGMRRLRLANLSVMKTPYLSGALRYDTEVGPGDGLLAVNLRLGCGRPALVRTLAALTRSRFSGRPGCLHWAVPRLRLLLDAVEPLELDGEVVLARRVTFEVLERRVLLCA